VSERAPIAPDGARYVYGVVRSDEIHGTDERGVFNAPVRLLDRDGLAGLVSDVDGPVPARRADLLAHFRVLEDVAARGTVLPLRFGTMFDSDDEVVRELLVRRREVLDRLFEELDGTVEVAVRAMYDQGNVMREILAGRRDIRRLSERTKGLPEDATYFDRIRLGELVAEALAATRDRDADEIGRHLTRYALAVTEGILSSERMAFSASFLVQRERLGAFEDAVDAVRARAGGRLEFRVTGPLPPYSFVSLEEQPVPARGP
jgi:hypothetical protein